MKFTKMQGIGNDYIYVNCFEEQVADPAGLSRRISDRHFGVGSDGLVLIMPCDEADFRMRMFNADGSESEMCGNATRCIGKYVFDRGLTDKRGITLMTGAGIKTLRIREKDGITESVRVDMGEPEILGTDEKITVNGTEYTFTRVSTGNPHAVIFVDDADAFDVHGIGPLIENDPMFPARTNVEFATVRAPGRIRMRVWERGSGETMACGTGACATMAAAVVTGRAKEKAVLELNGGNLTIEWDGVGHTEFQEGPAEFVFDGELPG
ncbi:MAG: diaminopimelate epimerase [Clostridiales bacterium]|nr:diaminopimelate epimerase [Clostridiales bacterium]